MGLVLSTVQMGLLGGQLTQEEGLFLAAAPAKEVVGGPVKRGESGWNCHLNPLVSIVFPLPLSVPGEVEGLASLVYTCILGARM